VAYSEGQLRTPFYKRAQADPLGEGRTHVDGIVGQFYGLCRRFSGTPT
jgi:hypothetical protein